MTRMVIWDWHGVLGIEKFWQRPTAETANLTKFQQFAFGDLDRVNRWMRGEVSSVQLAAECGVDIGHSLLVEQLYAGWPGLSWLNVPLFSGVASALDCTNHVLVTDNIDVFTDFIDALPWARQNLSAVINSSAYGRLKADDNSLFEVALEVAGMKTAKDVVLIDDSERNCSVFTSIGGRAIHIDRWPRRTSLDLLEPGEERLPGPSVD